MVCGVTRVMLPMPPRPVDRLIKEGRAKRLVKWLREGGKELRVRKARVKSRMSSEGGREHEHVRARVEYRKKIILISGWRCENERVRAKDGGNACRERWGIIAKTDRRNSKSSSPTPSSPPPPDASPSPPAHTLTPYPPRFLLFAQSSIPGPDRAHAHRRPKARGYVDRSGVACRGRESGCCLRHRGLLRGPASEKDGRVR